MLEVSDRSIRNPNLELFTIAECAAILNVSRKLVASWIHTGVLPAIKLGPGQRLVRIRKQDLEAFIGQQQRSAEAAPPLQA